MNRDAAFAVRPFGRMLKCGPWRAAGRECRQAVRQIGRFLMGSTELPR